jgi:hypothetical protein
LDHFLFVIFYRFHLHVLKKLKISFGINSSLLAFGVHILQHSIFAVPSLYVINEKIIHFAVPLTTFVVHNKLLWLSHVYWYIYLLFQKSEALHGCILVNSNRVHVMLIYFCGPKSKAICICCTAPKKQNIWLSNWVVLNL